MNYFLCLIFSFGLFFIPPSKKEVKKAIAEKNDPFARDESWYTKNDDSCFYKLDTIRLYKNSNYMYHADHNCDFLVCAFGNRFSLGEVKLCQEPPLFIGTDEEHCFDYHIKEENGNLILKLENKLSKQSFRILELKEVELGENGVKCKEMTLLRMR